MKRIKLLVSAFAVALVAMFALAPAAQAQDVPLAQADPAFVEAAGEYEFTITGSGWIAGGVALVPCTVNTYEALAAGGAGACDTASLTIGNAGADGTFSVTATYTIPEGGMCIGIGGGAGFTEQGGGYCVGVGAPILPNSGSESAMVAIIGAAVLAGGAMIVLSTRRRSFVS
ncbi:MAG: hypothetical protein CL431_05545 [Acidimicrobiaceae bacterium]|jgi:LPXTG-motif cell wall-anchored protein|nr:hypothetical protein [Acidimicrobiaceae bacterium]|tara:strand:- start:70338 stop:70853 length:516 start_codon:yes stop_codon:yes gene_type:complete